MEFMRSSRQTQLFVERINNCVWSWYLKFKQAIRRRKQSLALGLVNHQDLPVAR